MKRIIEAAAFFILLASTGLPAAAASILPYRSGPRGGHNNTVLFYEVTENYSVDLVSKLRAFHNLPGGVGGNDGEWLDRDLGWRGSKMEQINLFNHVNNLATQTHEWDFVKLDKGILTVKKGYRWDGASTIGNDWNISDNPGYYLRGSCLHDAMYDLMRMGYLERDSTGNADRTDQGFMNRLTADCLMQMIFKEDGEDTLLNEFKYVRYGGAAKTAQNALNMGFKPLLAPWKYHISGLTACLTDDGVELRFTEADLARKDPRGYGTVPHAYTIERWTTELGPRSILGTIQDSHPGPIIPYYNSGMTSFFTDDTVLPRVRYNYLVKSAHTENQLDWDDRRYDFSGIVTIEIPSTFVPKSGPGPGPGPAAVPLPSSALAGGLLLVLLAGMAWRRKRRSGFLVG